MDNITKDPAYNAVDPTDFPAMLDVHRYGERSTAFDKIISATHDHFWDPLDTKYIDFSLPFDIENEYLVNPELNGDLKTAIGDKLDEKGKIKLANLDTLWSFSSILHGEQGALSLSASLCHILRDPGAQEYAANQTREEARHVTAFSRYIQARWGKPVTVGPALGNLLNELVSSPLVWKKLVGMQMLVEGLAMGAFATFYKEARDPLMRQVCQLVMTDEAFHHKFGKIWADRTIPKLSKAEHEQIEDWAWQVFNILLYNLGSPDQKPFIYQAVGLDPAWCQRRVHGSADRCRDPRRIAGIDQHLPRAGQDAAESRHHHRPHARQLCRPISTWPSFMPKATAWSATTSPKRASNI